MYFLGIDESGTGLYPLIYSCCISINKENLIENSFRKKRSNVERKRLKSFVGFPSKHLIFEKKYGGIINSENFKTIAIGEFSKFYSQKYNIKAVYMDGLMPNLQIEKICEMIYGINKRINFLFGKNLDIKLKLVNEADNWANLLFREFRNSSTPQKTRPFEFLPLPDVRNYEKYLI